MLNASEDQVMAAFEKVHGKIAGNCHAEVVYSDDGNLDIVGVACMKNGAECWRATLEEITFDLVIGSSFSLDTAKQ